ncbi:MAG: hypothetical protein FJ086_05835 [Deltaproteobacteria bacterium]|nr:hypothetical protein [Deltaproteobacteria bacterium]
MPARAVPAAAAQARFRDAFVPGDGDLPVLPSAPAVPPGPSLAGAQRGAALAVSDAVVLFRAGEGLPSAFPGGEVVANPANVFDAADRGATPRSEVAAAQVKANRDLEMAALGRLPTTRHAEYVAVRKALVESGDAVAALSLQKLLLDGALPGEKDHAGKADVLGGLHRLTLQPLADGVERAALLTDAVQELAWPPAVAQGNKNTCAPTVVQIHLLSERPAEYLRLLSGVASPEGKVRLHGGQVMAREPGTEAPDGMERSTPQRLLSPAMMEAANGRDDYDNRKDVHLSEGVETWGGLSPQQVDTLLEALHGGEYAFADMVYGDDSREAAWALLEEELQAGGQVMAGIHWRNGGHKVLVNGLETVNGQDWVRIINPWGQEERLPKAAFVESLRNINYRPDPSR